MRAILASVLLLSSGHLYGVDSSSDLQSPEQELAIAQTDLKNLHHRLQSFGHITTRPGLGSQTVEANTAFTNGKRFFEILEFLSAIREMNLFLTHNQVPNSEEYLQAHYVLGRSYEETDMTSRALTAYFRYLQSFTTTAQKNYGEMLDVVHRIMILAPEIHDRDVVRLNQILSSIVNLNVPSDVKPTLLYYAAKAAANIGNVKIAEEWLQDSMKEQDDPLIQARAYYIRALLHLNQKNYVNAEELLGSIILIKDKNGVDTSEVVNLARLALGRVSVHRKKLATAVKYYNKVDEKSESFKPALFESIYLLLQLKRDIEARDKAIVYLARYPDTSEAARMRSLVAYLDLRAGDTSAASASLKNADIELAKISKWMHQRLMSKTTVTHSEMIDFMSVTDKQIQPIPSISEGLSQFKRLAELRRRLADSKGELHNIVYTVGRMNIENFQPKWANQAEQLAQTTEELLDIGRRIVAVERALYQSNLTDLEKHRLDSSEQRRKRLLTKPAMQARKMEYWATLADFMDMTIRLSKESQKLSKAEAELAAATYLTAVGDNQTQLPSKKNDIAKLKTEVDRAGEILKRSLIVLRKRKIEDFLVQSPHRSVKNFLSKYALAINEESEVMQKYREYPRSGAARLLANDASDMWEHWRFLAKLSYEHIEKLDQSIKSGLDDFLASIEQYETRYLAATDELSRLQAQLESTMGNEVQNIVNLYTNSIEYRMARHKKWTGDIEWLDYSQVNKNKDILNTKYNLEKEMLNENMMNLQQGALWKWEK